MNILFINKKKKKQYLEGYTTAEEQRNEANAEVVKNPPPKMEVYTPKTVKELEEG